MHHPDKLKHNCIALCPMESSQPIKKKIVAHPSLVIRVIRVAYQSVAHASTKCFWKSATILGGGFREPQFISVHDK